MAANDPRVKIAVITAMQLEDDNLSPRGRIIYLQMQSDALYRLLKKSDTCPPKICDQIYDLIQKAVDLAQVELHVCDTLRLLCVYSLCKILCEVRGEFERAKNLAEDTVIEASSLENSLDENAISILQKLRDDYMTISLEEFALLMANSGMARMMTDGYIGGSDNELNPSDNCIVSTGKFKDSGPSSPTGEDGYIFGVTGGVIPAGSPRHRGHPAEPKEHFSGNVQTVAPEANLQLVRRVRSNVSLDGPIRLETLVAAPQIVPALDYIFRVYVRGNSLPGQQFGSGDVVLGDNKMPMGKFLLQGPFMSWKGFLEFVKDFRIAQLPNKKTRIGAKFYQAWDVDSKLYDEYNHLLQDAPLTMRDLAVIFIECSKTCTPALVLSKYLKSHYEDVFKRMAQQGQDGHGHAVGKNFASGPGNDRRVSTLPLVGSFMGEPWDDITKWLDESDDWNIVTGLNFVQFIDCVAKCGILSYSTPKFSDVLITPLEKIEHFLGAHLKVLGDAGGGNAWKVMVDARLKEKKARVKASIAVAKAELKDSLSSPRKGEKPPHKGDKASRKSDKIQSSPRHERQHV